ncbi:MAG: WD40/YVTN/BNR-like repeat-containing protein [Dehalococcoidia bacterium]
MDNSTRPTKIDHACAGHGPSRHGARLLLVAMTLVLGLLGQAVLPAQAAGRDAASLVTARGESLAPLNAIACPDSSHCWAVGQGVILATDDGGQLWTRQTVAATIDVAAVTFVDLLHGWAAGSGICAADGTFCGGVILSTVDAGTTWRSQDITQTSGLTGIACVDVGHCWAAGTSCDAMLCAGEVVATSDGGASWSLQSISPGRHLQSISFADGTHGWAGGDEDGAAFTLATGDGGRTWSRQTAPATAGVTSITCLDAGHCRAVGGGVLLATDDGGGTWQAQIVSGLGLHLNALACLDAGHCWLVGGFSHGAAGVTQGATVYTGDSGQNFESQDPGDGPLSLTGIACVDANRCWTVGASALPGSHAGSGSGAILATDDGGQTWRSQASEPSEP